MGRRRWKTVGFVCVCKCVLFVRHRRNTSRQPKAFAGPEAKPRLSCYYTKRDGNRKVKRRASCPIIILL